MSSRNAYCSENGTYFFGVIKMEKKPKKKISATKKNVSNKPAEAWYDAAQDNIPTDVLGSYTGTPVDGLQPVQDADDL